MGSVLVSARCTVGLLTWNGGGGVVECVRALLAQEESPLEIVWVDNASTDGTIARLQKEFDELPGPLIQSRNVGFCAGHNEAIRHCKTPYYLALNQDAVLEPDYIRRLCDWLDEESNLALAQGLILQDEGHRRLDQARVWSAGLVFPRTRFHFQLGMGGPIRLAWQRRRLVPGTDGTAMVLRMEAVRRASLPADEIFPESFFAYGEDIDLAQRVLRLGYDCGVDGQAVAWHAGKGSGGHSRLAIRAGFLGNHWLITLRNEPSGLILNELPYWLRGELQYWLPEYARHPLAFFAALGRLFKLGIGARRFYHRFERTHGPTHKHLVRARAQALDALRASRNQS